MLAGWFVSGLYTFLRNESRSSSLCISAFLLFSRIEHSLKRNLIRTETFFHCVKSSTCEWLFRSLFLHAIPCSIPRKIVLSFSAVPWSKVNKNGTRKKLSHWPRYICYQIEKVFLAQTGRISNDRHCFTLYVKDLVPKKWMRKSLFYQKKGPKHNNGRVLLKSRVRIWYLLTVSKLHFDSNSSFILDLWF